MISAGMASRPDLHKESELVLGLLCLSMLLKYEYLRWMKNVIEHQDDFVRSLACQNGKFLFYCSLSPSCLGLVTARGLYRHQGNYLQSNKKRAMSVRSEVDITEGTASSQLVMTVLGRE